MRAVSNTPPPSNLAFIGRLDLLKSQFSHVWIPLAVEQELQGPSPGARAVIEVAITERWLSVAKVEDTRLKSMLLQELHRGEAEAISLAVDSNVALLLLD